MNSRLFELCEVVTFVAERYPSKIDWGTLYGLRLEAPNYQEHPVGVEEAVLYSSMAKKIFKIDTILDSLKKSFDTYCTKGLLLLILG